MNRDIGNAVIIWLSYCQQEKEDLSNIFTGKARREFCDCKKSPNQALTGAEIEGWELFVNSPLFGPCSPRHFPIPLAFKSGEGASIKASSLCMYLNFTGDLLEVLPGLEVVNIRLLKETNFVEALKWAGTPPLQKKMSVLIRKA